MNTHFDPSNPDQTRRQVKTALKDWYAGSDAGSPLTNWWLVKKELANGNSSLRDATNRILARGLERMVKLNERDSTLLRLRFVEEWGTRSLCNRFAVSEATIFRWQDEAIKHLAVVLAQMETEANQDRAEQMEARLLPPSYSRLFGVDKHLTALLDLVMRDASKRIIAITGIGGIGKTSLADHLLRTMIRQRPNGDIAWVSAQQQRFDFAGKIRHLKTPVLSEEGLIESLTTQLLPAAPRFADMDVAIAALRNHMAERATVLVVDNLETAQDTESILPVLHQLASVAKIVLATRYNLFGDPAIIHYAVPQLSQADALVMLRTEARESNLWLLNEASDDELLPIYETVGGNPLALRLIIGQTHMHALDMTLANLVAARGLPAETLYTYIYRAAWDRLSETARRAWLAMVLFTGRGGTLQHIAQYCDLEPGPLSNALAELVMLNLIDSHGELANRRYSIHALTRSFLTEQVLKWQQTVSE